MEAVNLSKAMNAMLFLTEADELTNRRVRELEAAHQQELARITSRNAVATAEAKKTTGQVDALNQRVVRLAQAVGLAGGQPWSEQAPPTHATVERQLGELSQRWQAISFIEGAEQLSRSTPKGSAVSQWRLTVIIAAAALVLAPIVSLLL